MAASTTEINVKIGLTDNYTNIVGRFTRANDKTGLILQIIDNIRRGLERGKVLYDVEHTVTAAAQTVLFDSSDGSDGDTVTINGIVFTAKDSPSYDPRCGEFLLYADDDDAQGEDFAAAFNCHPIARLIGEAVNSSGTVTITTHEGGTLMNVGTLAASNADFATVGGANFASGAAGTVVVSLVADPKAANIL